MFEDLRKPARVLVSRAFRGALSDEEIDDVYATAWTSTLAAMRGRERQLDEEELRRYVLAAVANHASKEMRRRSRKPAGPLEPAHEQVLHEGHQPSPEERAIGSESASIARDVLASLPPRRRAVMLMRYGWGLGPAEICGLVANLSPRAYRKEITRGVEQLVDRLRQVENGEWCRTREPLLRDYVAGTASEDARRQAVQHIAHCNGCAELAQRLSGHLHELGGTVAWTAAVGAVGADRLSLGERLIGVADRLRGGAAERIAEAEEAVGGTAASIASSGGTRGAGAAGAGVLAKLAGLGAAGKATVACLGAGAAATACVATGVVPGVELPGIADRPQPVADRGLDRPPAAEESGWPADAIQPIEGIGGLDEQQASTPPSSAGQSGEHRDADAGAAPDGAPESSPAPAAPPVRHEFGLEGVAARSGGGAGTGGGGGGGGGGGSSTATDVSREFGP